MKKRIVAVLLAGILLTACSKDEIELTSGSNASNTTVVVPDDPVDIPAGTIYEEAEETPTPEDTADPVGEKPAEEPNTLFNDFFAPSLKEFDLPEGEDEMVTVVFQFVNITDKTYYKNDEEIPAGGSWEKTITYPRKKWEGMAGEDCWLHYDLYEDSQMQTQIYKGGLKFTVSEDLQVTDMSLFED